MNWGRREFLKWGAFLLFLLILGGITTVIAMDQYQQRKAFAQISRVRSDMQTLATAIYAYDVDNMEFPAMTLDPAIVVDAGKYPKGVAVGRTFRSRGSTDLMTLTTPIAYFSAYPLDPFAGDNGLTYRYHTNWRGWILGSYGPERDLKRGGQLGWDQEAVSPVKAPKEEEDEGPYWWIIPREEELPQWWPVPLYGEQEIPGAPARFEGGHRYAFPLPDSIIANVYDMRLAQPSLILLTGSAERGAFTYDPTNGTLSAGDVWRVRQ